MSVMPMAHEFQTAKRPRALTRAAHVLAGLALLAVRWIVREIRVRRDMRQLAEFSDYMLRDIGLQRTNIEDAVRHGRGGLGRPSGTL